MSDKKIVTNIQTASGENLTANGKCIPAVPSNLITREAPCRAGKIVPKPPVNIAKPASPPPPTNQPKPE